MTAGTPGDGPPGGQPPTVGALLRAVGGTADPPAGEDCRRCGHPYAPHFATADFTVSAAPPGGVPTAVPAGGEITCNVPGCDCRWTWSLGIAGNASGRVP